MALTYMITNGEQKIMNCWLIRPYPHNINRMPNFLENNIIAIGWPGIGDLTACDKQSVQQRILDK